jgi:peptide deformylase
MSQSDLSIVCIGNDLKDILHTLCVSVSFPLSNEHRSIALKIFNFVRDNENAAGLAAPQIGYNIRVMTVSDEKRTPTLVINPEITFRSPEQKIVTEGCLSIPGNSYKVSRPRVIKVKYYDIKGREVVARLSDWSARVFCHEYDHLEGITIDQIGEYFVPEKEV